MTTIPLPIDVVNRMFISTSSNYNDYIFQNAPTGMPSQNQVGGEIILSDPSIFPKDTVINIYNNSNLPRNIFYFDGSDSTLTLVPRLPVVAGYGYTGIGRFYMTRPTFDTAQRPSWRLIQGINTTTYTTTPAINGAWTTDYGWPQGWVFVFDQGVASPTGDIITAGSNINWYDKNFKVMARNSDTDDWSLQYIKNDNINIPLNTRYSYSCLDGDTPYKQWMLQIDSSVGGNALRAWNIYTPGNVIRLASGDFTQLINMYNGQTGKWYWERLNFNSNPVDISPIVITMNKSNISEGMITNYTSMSVMKYPSSISVSTDKTSGIISLTSNIQDFSPTLQAIFYKRPNNWRSQCAILLEIDNSPYITSTQEGIITESGNADDKSRGKMAMAIFKLNPNSPTLITLSLADLMLIPELFENGTLADPYSIEYVGLPAANDLFHLTHIRNDHEVIYGAPNLEFSYVSRFIREIKEISITSGASYVTITGIMGYNGTTPVLLQFEPLIPYTLAHFETVTFHCNTAEMATTVKFNMTTTDPDLKLMGVMVYCNKDTPTANLFGNLVIYQS